jgi:hypothetical protein
MAAFERIALQLRAVTTAHIALELVDGCRLSAPENVQRDRPMGTAAEAFDLKVQVAGIERIP